MKHLATIVIVIGFCVGTVGAAGFHEPRKAAGGAEAALVPAEDRPHTEELAWPLFLGGVVLLVAGGFLGRMQAGGTAVGAEHVASERAAYLAQLTVIRDKVVAIEEAARAPGVSERAVRDRIDALLRDEYFDFTSRNEDLTKLLGVGDYARVWEGVAVCERLLSRAWSMATDGWPEEGFAELPAARANIEHAHAALAELA